MPVPDAAPSGWVARFAPLIRPRGRVLDVAAGAGRHVRLLRARGYRVMAADRDTRALIATPLLGDPGCQIVDFDFADGSPWNLGTHYDGIVVTNYLHRPLLPFLAGEVLHEGGVLIYETFMQGNERFGRPSNPDFLLHPGELLDAYAAKLSVIAFEQGEVTLPRPAMVQRIAAVKGPIGRLPR